MPCRGPPEGNGEPRQGLGREEGVVIFVWDRAKLEAGSLWRRLKG